MTAPSLPGMPSRFSERFWEWIPAWIPCKWCHPPDLSSAEMGLVSTKRLIRGISFSLQWLRPGDYPDKQGNDILFTVSSSREARSRKKTPKTSTPRKKPVLPNLLLDVTLVIAISKPPPFLRLETAIVDMALPGFPVERRRRCFSRIGSSYQVSW